MAQVTFNSVYMIKKVEMLHLMFCIQPTHNAGNMKTNVNKIICIPPFVFKTKRHMKSPRQAITTRHRLRYCKRHCLSTISRTHIDRPDMR